MSQSQHRKHKPFREEEEKKLNEELANKATQEEMKAFLDMTKK